jgi:nucleoside-diphosphate-sugar epimerase
MAENTKRLHIAFLDFDDIRNPLLSGGQARATFEVARRLVKLGHQVTVICSRFPGSEDGRNEGIFYQHIGLGSRFIRLNNLLFFAALPFAVRKLRAMGVHAAIEAFTAPISTCFSPLFTDVPVIGMPTMFEAEQFAKKYHLPFHWVERIGAKFYRYFLAYSPANKAKMESLNPRVFTRIIPNGVDEAMLTRPISSGDYGFFIGRIDIIQKGLDLLIEACRIAGAKCPRIVIAGNGPEEEEAKLRKLIVKSGYADRINFVGRVDGERKAELLANARFGIYASRFEDFPLVPLELTGFAKPVVCFDIPGLRWVPHSVSLKAKAFDAADLARCLVAMNDDASLRAKLVAQCRPFAAKYGWNRIAEEYAEFCEEVIELDRRRKSPHQSGRRILILGGAGFIGSVVSYELYRHGDEVSIMDNMLYERTPRTFFPLRFVKGDIRERADLEPEIRRADAVVHLAALSNDPTSDLDPGLTQEINEHANELIGELCAKYEKRIVYASSCSVYGFGESVFTEESDLNPVSLYAVTKAHSEKILERSGANVVSLRFATAYGYTEKPRFDLVVNTMVGTAYFDNRITVRGGDQWRPLVHVKDIARAIHTVIHAWHVPHRVYNVGSNAQNYRIADLAGAIARRFPGAEIVEEPGNADARSYHVDFSRIAELGFRATHTVEDAIAEFCEAFRANKVESMENDEYYRVRFLKNHVDMRALFHAPQPVPTKAAKA